MVSLGMDMNSEDAYITTSSLPIILQPRGSLTYTSYLYYVSIKYSSLLSYLNYSSWLLNLAIQTP